MGNDAPIVHFDSHAKKWVYRGSALGGCETALLAARMGLTQVAPPESFAAVFAEGRRLEQSVIEGFLNVTEWESVPETAYRPGEKDLFSFGEVVDGQLRVEVRVGEEAVIRGHADGLVNHGPTVHRVLEVKAFGEKLMADLERGALLDGKGLWEKYRVQLAVMMHGLNLPAVFAAGLKVDDKDAEDGTRVIERVHYQYVDKPPIGLGELKARVARVEARAVLQIGDLTCWLTDYPCPFFFIHATPDEPVEVVDVEDDELAKLLTVRADIRAAAAVIDADLKSVTKEITEKLTAHARVGKGMKTRVGDWMVTWMEVEQPESVRKAYTSRYPLIKKAT